MPELEEAVSTIVLSMDGAYILMQEDGWGQAMLGALSLYDVEGKRFHTLYLGAPPEYMVRKHSNNVMKRKFSASKRST